MLAMGPTAHAAAESLVVPDASVLQYGVSYDAKVYFRNLNQVDASWLGCCYNYWIDVSTDTGRAQFSAFLTAKASHSRIVFFIADKAVISPFIMVGDF
ncbi:hypothetical protein ASD79_05275 [Caulobacter sp. Root655]|nr:hypothetical protein ASD79_05275 [Caulobacter sp. Root655]